MINEGLIHFEASVGKISRKLPVFYNPAKKYDRDINVELIKILKKQYKLKNGLEILSASGVRGLRLAKECGLKMTLNDLNSHAVKLIRKNAKMNNIKVQVYCEEANRLLRDIRGKFDYVDVDPFGSPIKFLEGAVIKTNHRDGVLAITATDSSSLSGTYPKTCIRKYQSKPLKTEQYHEIGIRILIKKAVITAAQYDIALTPIFSYSRYDYFRVYFNVQGGVEKTDKLLKQITYLQYINSEIKEYKIGEKVEGEIFGPVWAGQLWNSKLMEMIKTDDKMLNMIKEESKISRIGFYHLPTLEKKYGMKQKKIGILIKKIKSRGYECSRTHFNPQGIRTTIPLKELIKI